MIRNYFNATPLAGSSPTSLAGSLTASGRLFKLFANLNLKSLAVNSHLPVMSLMRVRLFGYI